MNCTSCGSNLPPGVGTCPVCGTPTPYNTSPSGGSYNPTVPASQYDYGTPQTPPTPPAPPTGYGTPPYGTPSDPYSNQQASPYGAPGGYVPPPPPVQPVPYAPGQFASPMQGQPPKPKSKLPLILGIVGGILLLLCVGACAIFYVIGKGASQTASTSTPTVSTSTNTSATATTQATPASTTSTSAAPSGQSIVPSAAAIIFNAKSASGIDGNYKPTGVSSTFNVNQKVYITFDLKLPSTGYIQSKWYVDGVFGKSYTLTVDKTSYIDAYFVNSYKIAATGTVEIYWCTKANCSDGQLATFVTFTVGSTSHIQSPVPASVALQDQDRRI